MSAELELARAGLSATWKGVRVVAFAVLLLAISGALAWLFISSKDRSDRLQQLEKFQSSIQARQRVDAAIDGAFDKAKASQANQTQDQVKIVIEHEQATEEARREDPTVDDFLRARIPQRLRDADARARRSRGLDKD